MQNIISEDSEFDEENESEIAREIRDFNKIELIGKGRLGEVSKCTNKIDQLDYAIKKSILKIHSQQSIEEALKKSKLLLQEPNVNPYLVKYFDSFIENEYLYLVMEYCLSSVEQISRDQSFRETELRQIIQDVCKGLEKLHTKNIVHLNLKPSKIMYSKTSKYKISDLGVRRLIKALCPTSCGKRLQRSQYMAPELFEKISAANEIPDLSKADIYSLGMII